MNCKETQDLLIEYLYGELCPEQARSLEEHEQTCPDCAKLLSEYTRIRGLTADLPEPNPDQMVINRIVAVAREESGRVRSSFGFGWLKILATLCLMAVVGGLVLYQTRTGLITQETDVRLLKDESAQPLAPSPRETPAPSSSLSETSSGVTGKSIPKEALDESKPKAPPPQTSEAPKPQEYGDTEDQPITLRGMEPQADEGGEGRKAERYASETTPGSVAPETRFKQDRSTEPAPLEAKAQKRALAESADKSVTLNEEAIRPGEPGPVKSDRARVAAPAPKPRAQAAPKADSTKSAAATAAAPLPAREQEAPAAWPGSGAQSDMAKGLGRTPTATVEVDGDRPVRAAKAAPPADTWSDEGGERESGLDQSLGAVGGISPPTPVDQPVLATSPKSDLELGQQALSDGAYDLAVTIFMDLLKRLDAGNPDRPQVLLGLAQAYEGLGNRAAARQVYEKLAKEDPKHRAMAVEKIKALQ